MPTPGCTSSTTSSMTTSLDVPHIRGCPAGLEYLAQVDHLLVHEKVRLLETIVGIEMKNKYVVKNSMGQFVFTAAEQSDICCRHCCGSRRPFQMSLLDYRDVEVLRLSRPLRCDCCLCFCCLQACIYRPKYCKA
ncbi:phospholipid scramblase 1-like [Dermacentor silvarum]|uniref:phospholipid scramblase 1-like n=1 Tax=Dermacentor silvarum TaxID=543639 RepID=UPI002101B43D|nr:phospholipid scramblase 1-like [Dermacentor silvarum]